MTLIGPGRGRRRARAADAALTAADLVLPAPRPPTRCCRPPGHHVTRSAYGGSCYLNNAALAAERLHAALGGTVALLDVDAHHGNGTQAIFYDRADVVTGSVHVDPAAGWFPHFLGFADEHGDGAARANRNLPLAPGTGDAAVARGGRRARATGRAGAGRAPRRRPRGGCGRRRPREPAAPSRRRIPRRRPRARRAAAADRCRAGGRLRPDTIGALVRETLAGVEEGATRA